MSHLPNGFIFVRLLSFTFVHTCSFYLCLVMFFYLCLVTFISVCELTVRLYFKQTNKDNRTQKLNERTCSRLFGSFTGLRVYFVNTCVQIVNYLEILQHQAPKTLSTDHLVHPSSKQPGPGTKTCLTQQL